MRKVDVAKMRADAVKIKGAVQHMKDVRSESTVLRDGHHRRDAIPESAVEIRCGEGRES